MVKGFDRKLLLGMIVLILAFLPVLASAMASLSAIIASEGRLSLVTTRTLILAHDLHTEKAQQDALVPVYVITADAIFLDQLARLNDAFDQTLAALDAMPLDAATRTMVGSVRDVQANLRRFEQQGVGMRLRGRPVDEVHTYFRREAEPATRSMTAALDALTARTANAYDQERRGNILTFHGIYRMLVVACALTVLFCLAIGAVLARLIRQKRSQDTIEARLLARERDVSLARKQAVETVAHDLKSPLSAISLMTELLQRRADPSHKTQTWLQGIASSTESMRLLIANLLDHAKIEAGSLVLDRAPGDLGEVLDRLVRRFEIIAARNHLTLTNHVTGTLPPASIDAGRMEQVFANLLGNAVKFTPANGTISLRRRVEDGTLTIDVSDTGRGMTGAQVARVFERYWQASETAAKGTGLGLSIARAIVEAHGGTLQVTSEPGVGSTFSVSIPVTRDGAGERRPGRNHVEVAERFAEVASWPDNEATSRENARDMT